ncbi:MAG: hypothetical protein AB7V40_10700 [Methyloceanibacter sp.]|jgi:hypothetical protein
MVHPLIKIGAALALGGVFFACPAYAVSPLSLDGGPSLLVPVQDEENEEVWRDLRPDITPPPAAVGREGEAPQATEPPKEEGKGSGEIEEKELKEDGLIPE